MKQSQTAYRAGKSRAFPTGTLYLLWSRSHNSAEISGLDELARRRVLLGAT